MTDPRIPVGDLPRRVLMLSPVGELGGAERVLLDFIASTRAVKQDLEFHVLTFADGPLLAAVERLGATASVLALPGGLHSLGDSGLLSGRRWWRGARLIASLTRSVPSLLTFVRALRKEIRRRSPDIVHSNGMKAHLLSGLATPRGVPLVWHIHDFLGDRLLAGRMLKLTARRVNAAIAVSEAVAQDTRRVLPSLRVVTILNAVDVDEFSPGPGDGPWLDRLAGMPVAPPGTLRVGLVATYSRWKGQDVFLRAAARVRESLPGRSIRFYVVGGPVYATDASQFSEAELRGFIDQLALGGSAGLVPFQADLPPVFRALDIVVHASTRPEPFGLAIVESMACGRPVVVARSGGAVEIVEEGLNGVIHAPGDAGDLTLKISLLLTDPALRASIGALARETAARKFTRARLGSSLLEVYRSRSHPRVRRP